MKSFIILFLSFFITGILYPQQSWIRINQLGYLEESVKTAVFVSKENIEIKSFSVYDSESSKELWNGNNITAFGEYGSFSNTFRLSFTEFQTEGTFFIKAGEVQSPVFKISNTVYNGIADFLLKYMRQQRCGYNPFLKDSCHTVDGFIVDHPSLTGTYIDVKGGWHDASDYLQYLTTSANAVYQMLFAYQMNPGSFADEYDADGNHGSNGIPDILDEAKWGLDWMVRMNPDSGFMFNQIADDRDHMAFRLPNHDSVDYGKDFERPVYFITGRHQGICKYKNRTTGVSSSSGKYASSFALGAEILKDFYPEFSQMIFKKAVDAYSFAKTDLGVCQTASCRAPYFYEEDNYVDDLELAAVQLFLTTGDSTYLTEAIDWGKIEPVTPWMGADTARHYQWYPFVNLGHYLVAKNANENITRLFNNYLKKGIDKVYQRGKDNPFLFGVPFIWCSNNLVSAMLTQLRLYNELTNDESYFEMEAALRDWLFGCNPWGTSMIIGLPEDGDYPEDPHSAFTHLYKYRIDGGLVDGPVYTSIYSSLIGITLYKEDQYAEFQSDIAVYHDDYGDYSTNEPTMDGTASLSYYLSSLQKMGNKK